MAEFERRVEESRKREMKKAVKAVKERKVRIGEIYENYWECDNSINSYLEEKELPRFIEAALKDKELSVEDKIELIKKRTYSVHLEKSIEFLRKINSPGTEDYVQSRIKELQTCIKEGQLEKKLGLEGTPVARRRLTAQCELQKHSALYDLSRSESPEKDAKLLLSVYSSLKEEKKEMAMITLGNLLEKIKNPRLRDRIIGHFGNEHTSKNKEVREWCIRELESLIKNKKARIGLQKFLGDPDLGLAQEVYETFEELPNVSQWYSLKLAKERPGLARIFAIDLLKKADDLHNKKDVVEYMRKIVGGGVPLEGKTKLHEDIMERILRADYVPDRPTMAEEYMWAKMMDPLQKSRRTMFGSIEMISKALGKNICWDDLDKFLKQIKVKRDQEKFDEKSKNWDTKRISTKYLTRQLATRLLIKQKEKDISRDYAKAELPENVNLMLSGMEEGGEKRAAGLYAAAEDMLQSYLSKFTKIKSKEKLRKIPTIFLDHSFLDLMGNAIGFTTGYQENGSTKKKREKKIAEIVSKDPSLAITLFNHEGIHALGSIGNRTLEEILTEIMGRNTVLEGLGINSKIRTKQENGKQTPEWAGKYIRGGYGSLVGSPEIQHLIATTGQSKLFKAKLEKNDEEVKRLIDGTYGSGTYDLFDDFNNKIKDGKYTKEDLKTLRSELRKKAKTKGYEFKVKKK